MSTTEERRWFARVAALEICMLCGDRGVQVAHRDFGKGIGIKTRPWQIASLCHACHRELTDSHEYSRDEKRALMDRAIVNTYNALIRTGLLVLV